MSGDLEYAGGAGGMTADLLDMRATARHLDDRCGDLAGIGGRARGLTLDHDLLLSLPFSPGSAARAEALLVSAATALTLRVLRLEALSRLLSTKADLIELADDAQAFGGRVVETASGQLAGTLAVPLALAAVSGGLLWFAGGTAADAQDAVLDALRGDISLGELADRLQAAPGEQAGDMREAVVLLLRDHPGVTDAISGGLPGFVNGAAEPLAPLVPDTYEGLLGALLALGSPHGLFEDRPVEVTDVGDARPVDLGSLEGIWVQANDLQSTVVGDSDASAVRVMQVVDGGVTRWVVQVPGTQEWAPRAGGDPSDLTTNLELMGDGDAAIMAAVLAAMRSAGIPPGEQVMFTGHSQGGITAMALAADDAVRAEFDVAAVFTGGSPIGRFALPDGVAVVALEHLQDPVPRLDSESNPDLPDWTTVTRDLSAELAAQDEQGRAAADAVGTRYFPNPVEPHAGDHYRATAALLDSSARRAQEGSADPDDQAALRALQPLQPFLGAGTYVDYRLERQP